MIPRVSQVTKVLKASLHNPLAPDSDSEWRIQSWQMVISQPPICVVLPAAHIAGRACGLISCTLCHNAFVLCVTNRSDPSQERNGANKTISRIVVMELRLPFKIRAWTVSQYPRDNVPCLAVSCPASCISLPNDGRGRARAGAGGGTTDE